MIGRIYDNQGFKGVEKFKSKVNCAAKSWSSKVGQAVKVDTVVVSGKTGSQKAEAESLSEADKCGNDVCMDSVHSPLMSVSLPRLEYATPPCSNGVF